MMSQIEIPTTCLISLGDYSVCKLCNINFGILRPPPQLHNASRPFELVKHKGKPPPLIVLHILQTATKRLYHLNVLL